jgi:hypothetical protein
VDPINNQIRGDIRKGGTVHVELRQPVAPGLLPSLQSRVLRSIRIVARMKAATVVILPRPPASALRTAQNADRIKSSTSALLPSLFASVPHAMPLLAMVETRGRRNSHRRINMAKITPSAREGVPEVTSTQTARQKRATLRTSKSFPTKNDK